ncbi:WG repeat-containing protein [Mucilaginibacter sp. RCC_168]|uniref:WG repeat-containing protein n=1 Tax=Mucilaginibacter sp. RCC_168 TaxID=3239221 RepID=UPI003524D27F
MSKNLSTLILFPFLFIHWVSAQPFIADKSGYVTDPKFHAFIKAKGYDLVGTYKIVQEKPLMTYAKVLKNGRWLFMDTNGKIIVNPPKEKSTYEVKGDPGVSGDFDFRKYVHPSNVNLKITQNGDKFGLTNTSSNQAIIPAIYDRIILSNFKFAMVQKNGKWGIVSKSGVLVIPPRYDDVESLGVNMAGTKVITADAVIVNLNGKWGLLSDEGEEIVSPQFDKIKSSWTINSLLTMLLDNKWGLMNKKGKVLIKPVYRQIQSFDEEGLAKVAMGDNKLETYGLIDSLGNELVKPIYTQITVLNKNLIAKSLGKSPNTTIELVDSKNRSITKAVYSFIGDFRNNLALVCVTKGGDQKRGYIDNTGKEVIKPIFDEIENYYGLDSYKIKLDGKYGIINNKQQFLVKPIYDELSEYDSVQGTSMVKLCEKYGIINNNQQYLIKPTYDYMECIAKNIYVVKKDNKYGIINFMGKVILPVKYEHVLRNYDDGLIQTYLNNKPCTIDLYGNEHFN